jgi:DNA mismatch endonuclease (patch repair protein)
MDIYSKEKRSEIMSKVRSSGTKPEVIVRKKLHSLGFRFRLHNKALPGKPDIVLPKHRVVVFVHGCFWHHHNGCGKSKLPTSNAKFWRTKIFENVRRDAKIKADLKKLGWRILVIWECETKNTTFAKKLFRFFTLIKPVNSLAHNLHEAQ